MPLPRTMSFCSLYISRLLKNRPTCLPLVSTPSQRVFLAKITILYLRLPLLESQPSTAVFVLLSPLFRYHFRNLARLPLPPFTYDDYATRLLRVLSGDTTSKDNVC